MKHLHELRVRFARDERGAIAIVFGLSLIVLSSIVAFAIDTSRFYSLSSKLQAALDAAALAAARMLDEEDASDAAVVTRAESFFQARIAPLRVAGASAYNFRAIPDRTDGTVRVSVDTTISTIFGHLANIAPSISFSPQSVVSYRMRRIELALVLDITGSMCDAPPATQANACSSAAKLSALKSAAADVVQSLAETAPGLGNIKVSIVPYAASVNLGGRAAAWSAGASTDSCLIERSGGGAHTDAPPSDPFEATTAADFPAYSCPEAQVMPLTDVADPASRAALLNRINSLKAFGGTAGHIGAAWGWYTVSPRWSSYWPASSQPRPYDPDKTIKAVILMTDGMFNTSYRNGGEAVAWPNPQSSDATVSGTSGNQALKLCDKMQDEDIRVYTVGFQTPPEAEALLKECSGADNFYNADNASQLNAAFRDIAKRLTNIRVSS